MLQSVRGILLFAILGLLGVTSGAEAQVRCPVAPAAPNALIRLSKNPLTSVDDAYLRMQCLEAALRLRNDRRSVFMTTYRRTTQTILENLQAGVFIDTRWSERYTVLFAEQYRRAFYDWERGATWLVPPPWRIAFASSRRGDALYMQEVLLGINAHVNYDLANTLYEVGIGEDRQDKLLDHSLINDILQATVDAQMEVLAELYAPGIAQLPAPVEDLAEELFNFSLITGRMRAWERAVSLTDAKGLAARALIRRLNSAEAEATAGLILAPGLSASLTATLRALERGR